MTKRTQRAITVFLLGVVGLHLVAPLLLQGCIYYVRIGQRNTILEITHHPELFEKIILSEEEFSALALEESDEFTHHHILYDIHSIKKVNNQYIILALSDERETTLEKLCDQQTSKDLQSLNHAIKQSYFQLLYLTQGVDMPFLTANQPHRLLPIGIPSIVRPYLKVPTPPPDSC